MTEPPLFLELDIERLRNQVQLVYDGLVRPNWGGELHGFDQTLYAYLMMVFAQIDRASALWAGSDETRGQTQRMVRFMDRYVDKKHEANAVAVQIWRHKLMHTARPRTLRHESSGKTYKWLLHWGTELPRDQHLSFSDTGTDRILGLALIYLIDDMAVGIKAYLRDLHADPDLKRKFTRVQGRMARYEFRPV